MSDAQAAYDAAEDWRNGDRSAQHRLRSALDRLAATEARVVAAEAERDEAREKCETARESAAINAAQAVAAERELALLRRLESSVARDAGHGNLRGDTEYLWDDLEPDLAALRASVRVPVRGEAGEEGQIREATASRSPSVEGERT